MIEDKEQILWDEIEPVDEATLERWRDFAGADGDDGAGGDRKTDVARAVVTIERAWKRIGELESKLDKITKKKECPACGGDLDDGGDLLVCPKGCGSWWVDDFPAEPKELTLSSSRRRRSKKKGAGR